MGVTQPYEVVSLTFQDSLEVAIALLACMAVIYIIGYFSVYIFSSKEE